MRLETEDYADQKLAQFEIVLERTLKTVASGRQKLAGVPEKDEERMAACQIAAEGDGRRPGGRPSFLPAEGAAGGAQPGYVVPPPAPRRSSAGVTILGTASVPAEAAEMARGPRRASSTRTLGLGLAGPGLTGQNGDRGG